MTTIGAIAIGVVLGLLIMLTLGICRVSAQAEARTQVLRAQAERLRAIERQRQEQRQAFARRWAEHQLRVQTGRSSAPRDRN